MKKELTPPQHQLLNLISHTLFPNNPIPAKFTEKELSPDLITEAVSQTVLPFVYSAAQKLNIDATPCLQSLRRILANNMVVEYEHSELHNLLQAHNIPYVILKGCVSASYYPEPALRTMGDVDFLVKESDLERVGEILEKDGYIRTEDHEHEAHIVYHRPPKSVLEMHWRLSGIPQGRNGDRVREYFSDIIETARTVEMPEGSYRAPDDFHHCLVLLVHTAGHMINTGIGLRHLCDWAVFTEKVDIQQWHEELSLCGLWRYAKLLTQLSVRYLHMPGQLWAMEDAEENLLEAMVCDIFAGGNFGKKDDQRINQAKLMTDKEKGGVDGESMIKQLVSVMNEKAGIVLPVCRKIPILLPIGWIYAGGRHLLRIKDGKRPQIHMKEMVEGAAERREIYKKFHLFESE